MVFVVSYPSSYISRKLTSFFGSQLEKIPILSANRTVFGLLFLPYAEYAYPAVRFADSRVPTMHASAL